MRRRERAEDDRGRPVGGWIAGIQREGETVTAVILVDYLEMYGLCFLCAFTRTGLSASIKLSGVMMMKKIASVIMMSVLLGLSSSVLAGDAAAGKAKAASCVAWSDGKTAKR